MTTLRNTLFKMLCNKTVSQIIYINQRHHSKKWPGNKAIHFDLDVFLCINQSVKKYLNAPYSILQGRPDNNRLLCIK